MHITDFVKVICAVFACNGISTGTCTKTGTPAPVAPKVSSRHTIHVNFNISISFPNPRNNYTVPIIVHNSLQNTQSVPNDCKNSNNSYVPIRDPENIGNSKPDKTINKPPQLKTEVENDLSWVEKHPNWIHLKEPLNAPCGESVSTDRIIGGNTAILGEHPWIARLGRFKFYNGKVKGNVDWYCAGTIINSLYILTAAHCSYDKNLRIIRLGEYDAQSNVDCDFDGCAAPVQDFAPQNIIRHRGHILKEVTSPHDIALIRLESEINFNGWVAPICLPYFNDRKLFLGNAETIGWGLTIPLVSSFSAILQTVHIPITSEEECRAKEYNSLAAGTFCAGGVNGEDSCNGDSGGPLLKVNDYDGFPKYYGIGIVSFGPALCGNGRLGAYTNISSHMYWILNNLRYG